MKNITLLIITTLAVLCVSRTTLANTYTVLNTNDTGAGSFSQAVLDANALAGQDTIVFDAATNTLTIQVLSLIDVQDDLVILGNGVNNTIFSHEASAGFVAIQISAGNLLKFVECKVIANTGSSSTLKMFSTGATLEVESCSFDGTNQNSVMVASFTTGTLKVNNSTFVNSVNTSIKVASGGNGIITNNSISSVNEGVRCEWNNTVIIENNTVTGVTYRGIYLLDPADATLRNNTITNCNPGIAVANSAVAGVPTFENNIIFGNTTDVDLSDDYYPITINASNNIVGTCQPGQYNGSACPTWYSSANPMLDPLGLQNNGGPTQTIALQAGSPAINNANGSAPVLDQRGYLRPDAADIGAYEFNGYPPCDPMFTAQPSDLTICEYDSILFTYAFSGGADSIQWHLSTDGMNWFVDDPTVGDSLAVDSVDYTANGFYLMAVAFCGGSGVDSTNVVQLTVIPELTMTATDNSDATITASTADTYQWIDCATNQAISGATTQTFSPTSNGSYAVIGTNGSLCSDTSACVSISNVGIAEVSNPINFTISPNPAENSVVINFNGQEAKLSIVDATGSKVQIYYSVSNNQLLDLTQLDAGIYFLYLEVNGADSAKKLVKK